MAPTYTTAARIASLLHMLKNNAGGTAQVRFEFDATSLPTLTEINDLIEEIEDDIDNKVHRSWKENTVSKPEYHEFRSRGVHGRYVDRSGHSLFGIRPNNQDMRTISGASGDKIEIWDGNSWIDFVATKTLGDAMYDGDYWVDYDKNEIFIFTNFPPEGNNMIRLTYRWGLTTVPKGIRRIATLMAGAEFNERYEMYKESSKDSSPAMNQAQQWRERAEKLLKEGYPTDEIDVI